MNESIFNINHPSESSKVFHYLGPVQLKTRPLKAVPKIKTHSTISQGPIDQLLL
jgi:hypothetical protein